MSTTTKRPPAPKPPTSLSPTCTIADSALLTGTHLITIGANAIIHPRARLVSTYGPVTIGEGCVVWEKGSVGLLAQQGEGEEKKRIAGAVLERGVEVRTNAVVEGVVGEGAVVGVGARVGRGCVVGSHSTLAPLTSLSESTTVPPNIVVYGHNEWRTAKGGLEGLRARALEKQVESSKRLIPSNVSKWQMG